MGGSSSRVYGYLRVSTVDQLNENQREQIKAAGYVIPDNRIIEEKISGSVPATQRPGFAKLLERLEDGDSLIVTKLDRLGRDSIDVQATIKSFKEMGVRLIVLQLGNLDLTSSAGALMTTIIAAIAQFERELIIERTLAGQARAKAEGKVFGRKPKTTPEQRQQIRRFLTSGETVSELARQYGISRASVIAIRETPQVCGPGVQH